MKDKTCSVDALAVFVKETVISNGEPIHTLCGSRCTEFMSAEFRQYCQDVGIKLDFASPNPPQQIGANERVGRTILKIVRCFRLSYVFTVKGEFSTSLTGMAHSALRNTRTLWEQRKRMFHGQSRKRGPRPKPPSGTQQQNARSRVLNVVKFKSLFRALPFPLDGSESIRSGCSSARRTAPSRLV